MALSRNASIEIIYHLREAVGEGADRNTRGRVCSPSHEIRALGEDLGHCPGLEGVLHTVHE